MHGLADASHGRRLHRVRDDGLGRREAVRHQAEGVEEDRFDDAMVANMAGVAKAMRGESAELEALRGCMVWLARQVPR